mgnify:CR=1 FL=1
MLYSSQSVSLRLEARQLPALRVAFTEAAERIRVELARLRADGYIPEPWLGDEVSIETHNYYTQQVMGPVGTPFAALVAYQDELERVRDTLQAMEDHYRRTEGENTAQWKDIVWVRLGETGRVS